ncbi:hypothetical protein D3C86_2245800 [compost metagenome]
MSDAKRLVIINEAAEAVEQNFSDLRRFNTENAMLSVNRTKDLNEIEVVKRMYGIR